MFAKSLLLAIILRSIIVLSTLVSSGPGVLVSIANPIARDENRGVLFEFGLDLIFDDCDKAKLNGFNVDGTFARYVVCADPVASRQV